METISKFFSFKNRHNWSDNRFAWVYAIFILTAVVVFAIILKVAGIYESMAWRVFNAFFIIIGFILMVKDYKKHKDLDVSYTQATFLCFRCGLYFALLFLPALAFIISGYPHETEIINKEEAYNSNMPVLAIVFANYVETAATLAVACFTAAHFAGFKSKN